MSYRKTLAASSSPGVEEEEEVGIPRISNLKVTILLTSRTHESEKGEVKPHNICRLEAFHIVHPITIKDAVGQIPRQEP